MCGVIGLGRGPRRLRLAEQLEQLAVRQLRERTFRRPGAERRIMGDAPAPLRSRALLEDQGELVAAVHRHAAGGKDLPAFIVYRQDAAGHGPLRLRRRSDGDLTPQLPGVRRVRRSACNRRSSLISSGRREAWARWDISVGLSENSMNNRGSLALRNNQMRWPRASANWLSSRSVLTYSVSFWLGTRTRAAVRTFAMVTPLPRETPAAAASRRPGTCRRRHRPRRDDRTTSSAFPSCESRWNPCRPP